jgi:hypothetical protein
VQETLHENEEHYKVRLKELEDKLVQSVSESSKNEAIQL